MTKVIFALLLAICTCFAQEKEVDILFVGYDAGESHIWVQLLDNWKSEAKVAVLTMGTAAKLLEGQSKALSLEELNIYCPRDDRSYALSEEDLRKLDKIKCAVVVTGVFSMPQQQIAAHFASQGAKVISVWDNFSLFPHLPESLTASTPQILLGSSTILTPSVQIASDLNERFSCKKAVAIGQPTLDIWEKAVKEVDRKKMLEKTPFTSEIPIVLYVSGYQERGNQYHDAFSIFASSLLAIKSPIQVLVQLHPRSDGAYEAKVLEELEKKHSSFPPYFISRAAGGLFHHEAVALCDVGVCHRSTMAVQALFAGKPFLHVDVPGTSFSSFAIETGLIPQVTKPVEATRFIDACLEKKGSEQDSPYEKGGIVPHGTDNMLAFLDALYREGQPSAEENAAAPSKR